MPMKPFTCMSNVLQDRSRSMSFSIRTTLVVIVLSSIIPLRAIALDVKFSSVAGDFVSVGNAVIGDGMIAFRALGEGREGVYAAREGEPLRTIADRDAFVPDSRDIKFSGFGDSPHVSERSVIFSAATVADVQGVYLYDRGLVRRVIDSSMKVPGKDTLFASFGQPSIDSVQMAFVGVYDGGQGVYRIANSRLYTIATIDTIMPQGSEEFRSFGHPHAGGGSVVFKGLSWNNEGIYIFNSAGFRVVADYARPVPQAVGNFKKFGDPAVDGGYVVFKGVGGGRKGLYLFLNGELSVVADDHTEAPGTTANFSDFASPSVDAGSVAFVGKVSTQHGIYLYHRGVIYKVVDLYDTLEGQGIRSLSLSRQSLEGGAIVFRARLDDGSWGIYEARFETAEAGSN